MAGFTKKLTTANGWNNLGTLMTAAGYKGGGIISSLGIINMDAATTAYLHLSQNGAANPSTTAADGWPIVPGADDPSKAFYSDRGANSSSLDIGTTWINTVGVVNLKVIAVGN